MELEKDLITIENSKKLLNNILLSIKSSEGTRLTDCGVKELKNGQKSDFIETSNINTKFEDKKKISSFCISISRWEKQRWFKSYYEYQLNFKGGDRGYDKIEIKINDHQDIIEKIYNFLIDLERNKKNRRNKSNNRIYNRGYFNNNRKEI